MNGKIEQHVCIIYCVKLGKSTTETLEMLREAFGEHSLNRTVGSEWRKSFKPGIVSVEDDKRPGRPSTSKMTENVEKFRKLIKEARRRTIHELADNVDISYAVCQELLTENLNMRRIVPSP
jgi:hypothetical protein